MKIRARVLSICAALALILGQNVSVASGKLPGSDVELIQVVPKSAGRAAKAVVAAYEIEGIVVFEVSGDYDRGNVQSRADVAQRYFERYQDQHDALFVFTDFEFATGEASAFANLIKNDVQGLGLPQFDATASFGSSSGRLHNYIDMSALSRWEFNPSSPRFSATLDVAAHEVMHRWVAHPKFLRDGLPSDDLLGRDMAHWNFFLDSDASIMYGSDWRIGNDTQFEAIDIRHRLSPLDLYLAGFFSAAEVPDMTLIRNGQGANAADFPVLGFKTPGTAETISIAQIIAASGPRQPDVSASQKRLSAGIVLLIRPGYPVSERAIFDLQRFALDFETRFSALTRGRAAFSIRNQPRQSDALPGAPSVINSQTAVCTSCIGNVDLAMMWLRSKQRASDGAFVDKELNALPTTAAALRALIRDTASGTEANLARSWLSSSVSRQFDDLAWKERALIPWSGGDETELALIRDQLLASASPGLVPTASPSAWDAAAALASNQFRESSAAERTAFLNRLRAMQNADGGFGISPGGASHIGLTAWVLNEAAPLQDSVAVQISSTSSNWLLEQWNLGGGFGLTADAVLPTAWAVAGWVRLGQGIDISAKLQFLRQKQSVSGDWNGSIFTTAEVVRVLSQIDKPNLSFDAPLASMPAAPITGDIVELRTRLRNDGKAIPLVNGEGVKIAWFRGDPDQGGVPIGVESDLGAVGAGQSIEIVTTWNSTGVSGPQQFFAVLDRADAIDELNEDDNRQNFALDIGTLPAVPDAALLRENFSLSPIAVTVYPAAVTLTGRLTNAGGAALSGVPIALYSIRNGLRAEMARQTLDVGAQAETPVSFQFTLQRGDPLQLALIVDPENGIAEIRESNNELLFELSSSSGIDLSISPADLVQLTLPAVSGQPIRFRVIAHNNGATASPSFVMQAQVRQGAQTHALGNIAMQLDAGASSERELVWTPTALGTASLEVTLDPLSSIENEVDRSNNSAALGFEVVDPSAPNLLVRPESIQLSPNPLDQARPANLRALIANAGASITDSYIVAVSSGGQSGPRTELARISVAGGLASGVESEVSVSLPALTTSGDRYFFVTVDPDLQIAELNDRDNTAFVRQHVRSIPDASVTIASMQLTPSVPIPGQELRADITIRNLGEQSLSGLVARLFSGTPQDGTAIPSDQIAANIAGGQTGQLSWTWVYAASSGAPALSIQLDPGNLIAELREDNNVAVVPLQILSDQYATEPYISPNDDGIKESTQVVFRQLAGTPAVIDVRDFGDRVVRTYTPEEFIGGTGWAVLWDGRDDDGNVVFDGRYRVQASTANGELLGEVAVVVDTNRSSILEAVGTGLEKYTELVHSYGPSSMALPPVAYPDQDTVLLVDPLNLTTADALDRLKGIYRYDVLLQTLDPVIDGGWMLAQGADATLVALHWADGGQYVAFVLRANNQDSVWKARVEGRNIAQRLAGPMADRNTYELRSSGATHLLLWSWEQSDIMARRYRLDTGVETVLQSAGTNGSLIRVLDDGVLAGNSNTELHFISFDASTSARTVLDSQGPGYVVQIGSQGALVHFVQGTSEAIEWRALRNSESRILLSETLNTGLPERRRCVLSTESSRGFGAELLVQNRARRNVALLDVDAHLLREIALPLVDRIAGYVSEFDVYPGEYTFRGVFLGVDQGRDCPARVGVNSAEVTGLTQAKSSSSASAAASIGVLGVTTAQNSRFALVYEGESVRILNQVYDFEQKLAGAVSAYMLERATGQVTYLGSYSEWPLQDARDQRVFPAPIQNGVIHLGAGNDGLVAEYEQRTSVSNPFLQLADGSGIGYPPEGAAAPSYPIFLPGGHLSGAQFANPTSLIGTWPSELHLLGTSPDLNGALRFHSSLANQTTKLRVRSSANGIDLRGIASDKNFRQFELEWANFATPEQWNAIGPVIQEPAIDGEFMSWTPPSPGQFLIRLTTEDAAGNRRRVSARALSQLGSDIANTQLGSRYISPNGDGIKDALGISLNVLRPTTLRFSIRNASSAIVHTYEQQVSEAGRFNWTWDGRLVTGQIAADGRYRVSINDWFATGFTLDNSPPALQLSRAAARGREAGKVMEVVTDRVSYTLAWDTHEINPATLVLERADASAPSTWTQQADNMPAMGRRASPGSDTGSYRLVAEDRAGNRVVSPATGFAPDDFALVGRWVWTDPQDTKPWGCVAAEHDPYSCVYARTFGDQSPAVLFRGAGAYPIESDASFAMDLYFASTTPRGSVSLRYRVDAFGSNSTPNAPWQSLPVAASELDGAKLRLSAVAPTLPLGSLITVQAATQLNNGSLLYSEQSVFQYTGISPPAVYIWDSEKCSPRGVEQGLPPPVAPGEWACFEEQLQGLVVNPTLTVIGSEGQVIAVQSPVRNTDGVVLFEIPDTRCKELIARATSRSGKVYEARRLCESGDIVSFLGVSPAIESSCDAAPRNRIRAQAAFVSETEVEVTRIQAYFQPQNQPRRMVIDVANPPDLDTACARSSACLAQHGLVNEIDVSDLVDGRYAMTFEATLSAGGPIRHERYFYVDRTPALFDIRTPREGHRECSTGTLVAAANGGNAWKMEFPIAATVSDASGVAVPIVRVGPIPPASAASWNAPAPGEWNLYRFNTEQALADVTLDIPTPLAVTYEAGTGAAGGVVVGPMTGPVSAQFAAVNWSGAPQCRVINFSSDFGIEVDADFAPTTTFLNGLQFVAVINPIGEPRYQSAEMLLRAFEPVAARIELWRGETPAGATRIAELHANAAYDQGTHSFVWNGRDANAQPLADDSYWLKVFATDDCGHEIELSMGVIVDTTAPIVTFDSPDVGAVISSMLVRIEGSASDASTGSYAMTAESADSITIANGSTVRPSDEAPFGHSWNRGDVTGPVILRATATDIVGNRSVTELPIQLAPRPSHLFDDAELVPEVFSPNADGRFDRVNIRYALATNADVTARVLRANGDVVAVLQNAEPKLVGNHTLQWDGTGIPSTGADGVYRIELHAVYAPDPDQFEVVDLTLAVDVSAPLISLLTPEGEFSKGEGALSVAIADAHFESATWRLGDRQGEVVTGGASALLELSEINEGGHGFVLNAGDSVANSARLERSLTIDRTIPNALISFPEEQAVSGGAATQATIEGVASDANFSRYSLRIASAADPGNQSVLVESSTRVLSGTLHALGLSRADGEYVLRLDVEDKAGHAAHAERRFHIDHTAPTAQLIEPVNNAYVQRRLRAMGTAHDMHLADYRLRIATPEQASLGMWSDLLIEHLPVNAGELGVIDLAVPDGDYFLELVARDKVQQTASSRIRIRLDSTPPLPPIELVAHRQGEQNVALAWNDVPAADFAGYLVYRHGARLNAALILGRSYLDSSVPNGTLSYEVSAVDLAGNESTRSNPAVVMVDREPPEVTLMAPQDGTSVSGLVDIVGTAFSESDFDRYRLSLLDSGNQTLVSVLAESNVSVRGSTLAIWDTSAAAPGTYRLQLEAWDRVGNRAEVAIDVTVDNLPPAAPSGLTAVELSGDGQVSWDANTETDLLGYVLLRNGNAVNGGSSLPEDLRVLAISTNSYIDPALVDGLHTWIVFAIDRAGNLSAPSAPTQLTISRRPPDIHIVEPIENYRFAESVRVLAASDDLDIAQVWFEFRAAGAPGWTAFGVPVTQRPYEVTWTPGAIALGHYEIRALIRDTAGLEDATPPVVRVRYDDLDPPPQVIGVEAHANGGDVVVSWNSLDALDLRSYRVERSAQASVEFQLVGEVPAGTTTLVDSDRSDGTLYYRVTAVDASGNAGLPSASDSAQVFSLSVDAPFSPAHALATQLTGSTPQPGTLRVSRDTSGGPVELLQIEVEQDEFSIPSVALVAGENTLLLRVTDAESNISRADIAWVSVGSDPSIPTGLAVAVHNHHVTASWNANPEPDIVGYRLFRNDFPALVERDLDDLIAVGSPDDSTGGALDGDPQTAWLANSYFEAGPLQYVALELQGTAIRQISGLQLTWHDGRRPLSLDILAHNGRAWIRLMSISNVEAQQTLRFAEPYRTDRLMIMPTSASSGQSIALEQVLVAEQPLIAANEYVDHVIEGSYAYTLSAVNALGFESARSAPANAEVGTSTPPAPVVLSGLVQGHNAQLSWTPSATVGVAAYRLLRDGVERVLLDASSTQFTDIGLANGSYAYSVIALDGFGDASVPSNTVTLTIAASGPGVPQNLSVEAPEQGSALDIEWQQGIGEPALRYEVRRSLSASGPFELAQETSFTQIYDAPLVNGTQYWYVVEAFDAYGNASGASAPVSGIPTDRQSQPVDPVVLSGQLVGRNAQLSWVPVYTGAVSSYQLWRNGLLYQNIAATQTSYVDSTLPNGTYSYRVVVVSMFGTSSPASNAVSLNVAETGPGLPEQLSVVAVPGGSTLDVSWQQGAGAPAVQYTLRRSEAEAGVYQIVATTPAQQLFDQLLMNGTRYWYTVEAFDAFGNPSGQTAPVSGVPIDENAPSPPDAVALSGEIQERDALLSWTPSSSPALAFYIVRRNGERIANVSPPDVSYADSSLPNGIHVYSVSVVDTFNTSSAASNEVPLTVNAPGPGLPEQLTVVAPIQPSALDVNWQAGAGTPTVRFVLRRAESESGPFVQVIDMWSLGLLDSPLQNGTRYWYTVEAFDALGNTSGQTAPVSGVPGSYQPPAPVVLSAQVQSRDAALSWTPSTSAGVVRYNVLRDGARIAELNAAQHTYIDPWLANGTYVYTVTAQDVYGTASVASNAVTITVDFSPPGIPTISSVTAPTTGGALEVAWVPGDGTTATRYALRRSEQQFGDYQLVLETALLRHLDQPLFNARRYWYTVEAFGASGDGSGQSAPVSGLPMAPQLLSDLSLRADDIRFLPAVGVPGQNFGTQITVRNLGTGGSTPAAMRLTLTHPNGTSTQLATTSNVPALAASTSATLGVSLGQLNAAGNYWLSVELVVSGSDANPNNHFASQRLVVSASPEPVLELSADAASFAPGTDATGIVSVRNAGTPWSGRVRLRVLTGTGEEVAQLPDLTLGALAFGAQATQAWRWATDEAFAGEYRVRAELLDEQNRLVATRIAVFEIDVVRDLHIKVVSDRNAYTAGDSARLNATLDYRSGNAPLTSTIMRLKVLDPNSVEVFTSTRALATLLPSYRMQVPATWVTSATTGVHVLSAELLQGGNVIALAQSSFVVNALGVPANVSGSIEPVPAPLIAGRAGQIDFTLLNPSASSLPVDALRLRLLHAQSMDEVAALTVSGTASALGQLPGALAISVNALPVGEYLAMLDWRSINNAAMQTLATRSVSVVDGIAPTIVLRTPNVGGWVRSIATLGAQVSDAHSGVDRVEIAVDGGAWRFAPHEGQGLYGIDTAGLSDGTHQFQFRARDRAGNESISPVRSFQVDSTPPQVTITGVADGDIVAHPVVPVITIEDAHLDRSNVALNGASFISGTTVGADGSYLLTAVAYDLAGNSAAASVRFTIDSVPPSVVFIVPLDGDETTLASIEARVQTDPLVSVTLTAGAYSATTTADDAGIAAFPGVPLMFGVNSLSATATDLAGNIGVPASVQVTRIDNSGAALVGSLVPSAAVFASGAPAVLNWQVVNPASLPAAAQTLRIRAVHVATAQPLGDETVVVNVPGNGQVAGVSQFATAAATLGRYAATLLVQVGSDSIQLATAEFDIHDAEPPALVLIAPASAALLNTPVQIRASASDGLGSVVTVRYRLDGAAAIAMTPVPGVPDEFESALIELPDADYLVQVDAVDNAGNLAQSSPRPFSVDRTPPQISVTNVADGGAYATAVTPTVLVTDAHPGITTINLDGQAYVSGTAIDVEGTHALVVASEDAAGNNAERSLAFRIDRTAPVIAFSFPAEGAILATSVIDVGGLTESLARVEFRVGTSASSVIADDTGGFIVAGVTLQPGANVLEARAIDALDNASNWISRNVQYVPNAGANLTAELTLSTVDLPLGDVLTVNYLLRNVGNVNVAALPTRVLWVSVADQQQLSMHPFETSLPPDATSSGNVQFLSADTLPGAHIVVLEGFLTAANGSQQWQTLATAQAIVRDVLAPNVAVIEPLAGSFVDTGFTLRVQASDVHSTLASVQGLVASSPVNLVPGPGAGEFIATVSVSNEGPLQISARAVDGAGNAAEASARQVIVDLLPPQIAITGVSEGALVNQPVTPQVQIGDVSPVQSSITLNGQTFVAGTAVIAEGNYLLRVRATDALGRSSESLRSFAIDTTPPTVTIILPKDGAIIFSDSTRVLGITEPLASVALNVGTFSVNLTSGADGVFSIDNLPLSPGTNRIAARATDRADNIGPEAFIFVERRAQPVVALQGSLDITATDWANGVILRTGFSLHNIGTADLTALPIRVEARRRDSQQLLQAADFSVNLLANAQSSQSFDWITSAWGLGVVDIVLIADLPGQRAPVVLDSHALNLVDRESPSVTFELPQANAQVHTGDPVRVRAVDRLSSIAITQLRIDGGDWFELSAVDVIAGQYGTALPVMPFGPHQLSARTVDVAGNVSSTTVLPITVVGVLPLSVSAPIDGSSSDQLSVDFAGSTVIGATVRVRRDGAEWQTQANGVGVFNLPAVPLVAGDNMFTVQAEDGFGNRSAAISIRVLATGVVQPVPIATWPAWFVLMLLMVVLASARVSVQERKS